MNVKLPAGLDLLWERLDEPAAEPKPGLSLSSIVRAAVELADAGGLDAVSMAKLAKRLGFTTMSLYRHVTSKNDVLLLMLHSVAAGALSRWGFAPTAAGARMRLGPPVAWRPEMQFGLFNLFWG